MKMNKFASALITLALTASMGTTVFAAEITTPDGTADADINATYSAITPDPDTVYSVDIEWGNLEFAYNTNDTKTWDADSHKFVVSSGTPAWTCAEGADKITVTNHSNVDIGATLAYTESNSSGITGSFDKSKISLAAPEEGSSQETAPTGTAQLTLNGTLSESASKAEIGTVTVTVGEYVGEEVKGTYLQAAADGISKGQFYTTSTEKVYTAEITASASINPMAGYNVSSAPIYVNYSSKYYVTKVTTGDGTYELTRKEPTGFTGFRYYGTAVDRRYKITLDLRNENAPTMTMKLL